MSTDDDDDDDKGEEDDGAKMHDSEEAHRADHSDSDYRPSPRRSSRSRRAATHRTALRGSSHAKVRVSVSPVKTVVRLDRLSYLTLTSLRDHLTSIWVVSSLHVCCAPQMFALCSGAWLPCSTDPCMMLNRETRGVCGAVQRHMHAEDETFRRLFSRVGWCRARRRRRWAAPSPTRGTRRRPT